MSLPQILTAAFVSLLFFVFAALIAAGRGDRLMAGYNTAGRKDKEKVNIKRLRLLMSIFCIGIGALVLTDILVGLRALHMAVFLFWMIVPTMILANTWAKKR